MNLYSDREIVKSLVDGLPIGVGLWYFRPVFCVLNSGTQELTGISEANFPGARRSWMGRVNRRDRTHIHTIWKQLRTKKIRIACEYRFLPIGKREEIWIEETSNSFETADGRIGGVISCYRDVTQWREQNSKENQTNEQLTRVIRGLVHDIRVYLHTIRGAVELVQLTGPHDFRPDDVVKAVGQINHLTDDLQEYFVPPRPTLTPARLDRIVENVVLQSKEQFQRRGVRLEVFHHRDLPAKWVDVQQLSRALSKVLEFSVGILPKGGELCIDTDISTGGGADHVEVRITSRSVSPLELDEKEVFQPFSQLRQFKAGLRITLAQEILLRNRGRILFRQQSPREVCISLLLEV